MFPQDSWLRRELSKSLLSSWLEEINTHLAKQAEGKMFGALVGYLPQSHHLPPEAQYFDSKRNLVVIRAYSGQLCGVWNWPGWAPTLLDHTQVAAESWRVQYRLHRLSLKINKFQQGYDLGDSEELKQLRHERTLLSRHHANTLRDHTYLYNLKGESCRLSEWWPKASTGVGDCCAPKLLSYASRFKIEPIAMAEFWIGTQPKHKPAILIESLALGGSHINSHQDLNFYEPCLKRCQPILPYLLGQKVLAESPHTSKE